MGNIDTYQTRSGRKIEYDKTVQLMSLCPGWVVYEHPVSKELYKWEKFQTKPILMRDLVYMNSIAPKYLKELWLYICEDEEVSAILEYFSLTELYSKLPFKPTDIEKVIEMEPTLMYETIKKMPNVYYDLFKEMVYKKFENKELNNLMLIEFIEEAVSGRLINSPEYKDSPEFVKDIVRMDLLGRRG